MDSRPKRTMAKVEQTQTRWMDPSFVLDQDIQAPVQDAQREWHWQVRYAKGTKFNPLTVQRPRNGLFFFDGNSEEEVKLATALRKAFPGRFHLIDAVGANPSKLTKRIGGPVFSMTDAMVARFNISTTPTLLYPGEGPQALRLGITSFASPYSVQQIEQAWPSIRIKIPEGSKK